MSARPSGIGRVGWAAAAIGLAHVGGLAGLVATLEPSLTSLVRSEQALRAVRFGAPVLDLGLALFFVFAARAAFRLPPATPGKLRAALLGVVGALHFPLIAAAWYVGLAAMADVGRARLSSFLSPLDVVYVLDPSRSKLLEGLAYGALASAVPMALLVLAHWFVLPEKLRARVFAGVDALVAFAFVYCVAKLPVAPSDDAPDSLALAATRHAVTAVFVTRAFFRLLPYGLDAFEKIDVRTLLAGRHLRSRRSNFLAAISFLSILAVMVSTCLLTSVLSVMGGFRRDLERKILGNSAHVVVDRESGTFEGWERTLETVRGSRGVVAASPYVQADVMITSASNLAGALLRGIDPANAGRVTAIEGNLANDRRRARGSLELLEHPERIAALPVRERCPGAGRDARLPALEPDDETNPPATPGLGDDAPKPPIPEEGAPGTEDDPSAGILIGAELARSLRLCVGDDLEVISPLGELGPAGPMPKTMRFRVAGIFYSGMYEYDMKQVYVTLEVAQAFLRTGTGISGIEARVADVESAPAAARRLRTEVGRSELRVQDWRTRNRSLFGALALEKLAMFVTLGITILIAGFCVFAALTLMVQEKRREVGILKAMGASDRSVIGIFLSEGLLIGLLGALSGLGLGYLASFAAEHFGIGLNPEVYYIDRLPVHTDPIEFVVVGASAVLVCVLSTIFPAVYASRLHPVDAVRQD